MPGKLSTSVSRRRRLSSSSRSASSCSTATRMRFAATRKSSSFPSVSSAGCGKKTAAAPMAGPLADGTGIETHERNPSESAALASPFQRWAYPKSRTTTGLCVLRTSAWGPDRALTGVESSVRCNEEGRPGPALRRRRPSSGDSRKVAQAAPGRSRSTSRQTASKVRSSGSPVAMRWRTSFWAESRSSARRRSLTSRTIATTSGPWRPGTTLRPMSTGNSLPSARRP